MTKIPLDPEVDILISKLKLEIKSLEDRLIDKDKIIDSLRYQSSKFIDQIERLTSLVEHRQGVSTRDAFLLKKAAHIISNFESRTNFEENTIDNIKKSSNVTQKLTSFDPSSKNADSAANEIDFYRNVDTFNFGSKQTIKSQKTGDQNPFQKTIDRIRVSAQKPNDAGRSRPQSNSILTDSRGDQLDEFINKNLDANPDSSQQSISKEKKQARVKKKPY